MVYSDVIVNQLCLDLKVGFRYSKSEDLPVVNCWHFYSDGRKVSELFREIDDYIYGTNLIYLILDRLKNKNRHVVMLSYVIMDTHFHFVLHGSFDNCKLFVQSYIRVLSMYFNKQYGTLHLLSSNIIDYQKITTQGYLKTVISYVIKNPLAAGMPYLAQDYPWSSGPLLFRQSDSIPYPAMMSSVYAAEKTIDYKVSRKLFKTHDRIYDKCKMIGDMIFPKEFVPVDVLEKLYVTHKSFMYYLYHSKESDFENQSELIGSLSIPFAELRQLRNHLSLELFGKDFSRGFTTNERVALAKEMRYKYNCSVKQIAKLCGLIYEELSSIL